MAPKEPKPFQYKNLQYTEQKPKFLQSAYAALGKQNKQDDTENKPTRPSPGPDNQDDDEGPQVVVLDEGKHLSREEADEYAQNSKENGQDVYVEAPKPEKKSGSLMFSSSSSTAAGSSSKVKEKKRKIDVDIEDEDVGDWDDLVKKVKAVSSNTNDQHEQSEVVKRKHQQQPVPTFTKDKSKSSSKKSKPKKANAKLLSFGEDEE